MLRRQSALKSQVKEEQQANFVYKLIDGVVLAPTSATKVVKLALAGVSKLLLSGPAGAAGAAARAG